MHYVLRKLLKPVIGFDRYIALREAYYRYRDVSNQLKSNDFIYTRTLRNASWLENVQRLSRFRNCAWGRRCFIIGNGPSLKQMDLSPLRDEDTFGLNRIYLLFPNIGFSTKYLVAINKLVLEQCGHEIRKLRTPKFISLNDPQQSMDEYTYLIDTIGNKIRFSYDIRDCVYESATVTFAALQIAYFMGYRKVVLIGVDHNFESKGEPHATVLSEGPDPNHFSPEYFGKGFRWQLPDLVASEAGYRLAREVYHADSREILDATVGGKLNVFPKVNFKDLF